MTTNELVTDLREWTDPLRNLADEMELCLYGHATPRLHRLSEHFWNELKDLFVIPVEISVKRVRHSKGDFVGLQKIIDNPKCFDIIWKDENGHTMSSGRSRTAARPPLYLGTQVHPLLSDLKHLDHHIVVIQGFCGSLVSPLTGEGPTPHTVERLRFLARRLGDDPSQDDDEYKPGSWFTQNPDIAVPVTRLRKAADPNRKGKRVKSKTVDGVVFYYVPDVRRWWPHDMPKT